MVAHDRDAHFHPTHDETVPPPRSDKAG